MVNLVLLNGIEGSWKTWLDVIVGGFTGGYLNTGNVDTALEFGLNSATTGAAIGATGGGISGHALKVKSEAAPRESTKLISQFSTRTIDDAVGLVIKDPNKISHLFASKHNLEPLVSKFGGQQNTVRAVLNAANGRLPASGVFNNIPVNVGGQTVFIRGNVINGVPRLGTMFIK